MNLVIVESPAKAKTINKYLGKDYKVLASYGHIRDLPSNYVSVDPEYNFQMLWEIDAFRHPSFSFQGHSRGVVHTDDESWRELASRQPQKQQSLFRGR